MNNDDILRRLEEFRLAYNAIEIPTLEQIVADDIQWEHHNKFKGSGREGLMRSIVEFGEKTPGRYFAPPKRYALNGQTIFVEQTWHATPASSDPAWGWEKGVPVSMDTCSVFIFADNRIVEWGDYG